MDVIRNTSITLAAFFLSFNAYALDPGEEDRQGAPSGAFDYLVYAVTWQPTFCLIKSPTTGCKPPPIMFLTHGIWAYFNSTTQSANRHPSSCIKSAGCDSSDVACELSSSTKDQILSNPDFTKLVTQSPEGLIKHEWQKHGTCYGADQKQYFEDFTRLRNVVQYDAQFNELIGKSVGLEDLKALFPANTSFRCVNFQGKQLLFEVFYLIDRQGLPYTGDQGLQIGEKCLSRETFIPGS